MRFLLAALFVAIGLSAHAQQPIDPRLSTLAIKAMQAEVELREAIIKAMREDQDKREADLNAWFTAWFGEQKVGQAEPK